MFNFSLSATQVTIHLPHSSHCEIPGQQRWRRGPTPRGLCCAGWHPRSVGRRANDSYHCDMLNSLKQCTPLPHQLPLGASKWPSQRQAPRVAQPKHMVLASYRHFCRNVAFAPKQNNFWVSWRLNGSRWFRFLCSHSRWHVMCTSPNSSHKESGGIEIIFHTFFPKSDLTTIEAN